MEYDIPDDTCRWLLSFGDVPLCGTPAASVALAAVPLEPRAAMSPEGEPPPAGCFNQNRALEQTKPNARLSDKSGMKPGTALETDDKNSQKMNKAGWK